MDERNLLEIGREYDAQDNIEKAYRYYLEAALSGTDGEAIYSLAQLYWSGDYVGQDIDKACHYFELAYECGYEIPAEYYITIGHNYTQERSYHKKDFDKASIWFHRALEKGIDYAYACLGAMYYEGDLVEQDYKKAYELFIQSGVKDSMPLYYLGQMYEFGFYVKQDMDKALEYYHKIVDEHPYEGDLHYDLAVEWLSDYQLSLIME